MNHMTGRTTGYTQKMLAGLLALAGALALSPLLYAAHEAQAADESETELAKKTQNPVADLITVPLQSNFNFNTGTKEATVFSSTSSPSSPSS